MRRGGGKAKGSRFERQLGALLSMWLTKGGRTDLFSRNVLSGGRFTRADKAKKQLGQPGDLIAAHPLAFAFLDRFVIEAKHHRDLQIPQFLIRPRGSFLGGVINHTESQAKKVGKHPLVIAKQNNLPALVFCSVHVGGYILETCQANHGRKRVLFPYHWFWAERIFCCQLEDLIRYIDPDLLLENMK